MEPRDGSRATRLWRRAAVGVAIVAASVALAIAPGWRSDDGPSRTVVVGTASEASPPTEETVQALASELSAAAGEGYDQPIDPDRVANVVTQPGAYHQLGELTIPAIGLDVAIGSGVDPDTLVEGPGHWTGTPLPGQPGNAVVSGHRTTHTAPFLHLDDLRPGDEIVTTVAGVPTTFRVTEVLVVPVEDYRAEVLAQPTDPRAVELTLFACHPEGSLTHRIVVHAERA